MAGPDSDDDEEDVDSDDEATSKKSKKGKGKGKEAPPVEKTPVLTKEILKTWQTSLLKVCHNYQFITRSLLSSHINAQTKSIRPLRKLLLAFAAAASSGGTGGTEGKVERWEIQSSTGMVFL
jgi:ribosomal protein S25